MKKQFIIAIAFIGCLFSSAVLYADESHIVVPTKHPSEMGIEIDKQAVCQEEAGTYKSLAPAKEGEYEDYAWFEYYNGTWTQLTISSPTISIKLPEAIEDTVWYYFTSVRIFNSRIQNGDFEQGNIGFESGYDYKTPAGTGTLYPESSYTVTSSISSVHTSASKKCDHDHTTGHGKMMAVNGDVGKGKIVWSQEVSDLLPHTKYLFSAWVMNWDSLHNHDIPDNLAKLEFSINGQLQGEVFSPEKNYGVWTRLQTEWFSGDTTAATIKLINQQSAADGNDFAVDDINFQQMEIHEQIVQFTFKDCYCIPDRVYRKWDDVLFCDNHDDAFVAYQWYCNEAPMEGATRQYVTCSNEPDKEYYCVVTFADGTQEETCPIHFTDAPRSAESTPQVNTPEKIFVNGQLFMLHNNQMYDVMGVAKPR